MEEVIINYLNLGKYEELENLLKEKSYREICNVLIQVGYKTNNIGVIMFVVYLYEKSKDKIWLEIGSTILDVAFCSFEGGYGAALFINKYLLKEEESFEHLYNYFMYSTCPDTEDAFSNDEVSELAEKILVTDPHNENVLSELKRRNININQ